MLCCNRDGCSAAGSVGLCKDDNKGHVNTEQVSFQPVTSTFPLDRPWIYLSCPASHFSFHCSTVLGIFSSGKAEKKLKFLISPPLYPVKGH